MNEVEQHLMTVFSATLDCASTAERDAYLDRACAGDPALRERVEALLHAHARAGDFLGRVETSGFEPTSEETSLAADAASGAVIAGRYKLLERIGEGGMGTVWMAEQTEPVKRRVAVKLIKAGMDSKQVLARFEAERQALALMDHPNIARVLDAGATAAGRPYFVMELVRGVSITRYCDEQRLTLRQRLELFVPVCQAVQHAHLKGIIHRDLKPSNVLVTQYDGRPVPKVIDFGIAKATGQQLTEHTLVTGFGAVVGTLEYMSPEQAELNNQDIDTRSDIYSLGVLLYEFLTGSTPLEKKRLKEPVLLEVLRVIREEEPPRPSTRLSSTDELPSVAANRGVEPRQLSGMVRGELDWVAMKCLEKDRNRRYETANGLAADVQRYLADQPVLACPPSVWYRLRKFTWRNKVVLAAGALVLLALVLGTIISSWQAIQATQARDAEREARNALDAVREEKDQQRVRTNRELSDALVEAARLQEKARATGPGAPDSANQLRATLGRAETLAASELADPVLVHRVRTLREELTQDERDRRMVARLEELHVTKGILQGDVFQRRSDMTANAYAAAFQDYGLPIADILAGTAREGRVEETACRIAASPIRDWLGAALAACAYDANLPERLLPVVRRVEEKNPWRLQYFDARIRRDTPTLVRLARQPEALMQPPAILLAIAETLDSSAVASAIDLLREAQLQYPADVRINLALADRLGANAWRDRHRQGESIGFRRAALAARPEDPTVHRALAEGLRWAGQEDEAVAVYRQLTRLRSADVSDFLDFGLLLWMKKDRNLDGAIAVFRQALELDPKSRRALVGLAIALRTKGDWQGAADASRKAAEGDRKGSRGSTGRAYCWFGGKVSTCNLEESAAAFRKAIELDPSCAEEALAGLGLALTQQDDLEGAADIYRKLIELNPKHSSGYSSLARLAEVLERKHDWGAAAAVFRKWTDVEPKSVQAHLGLADSLWRSQHDLDGAIASFRKAAQLNLLEWYSRERLGDLLVAKGDWDGAIAACREAIELNPMWSSARLSLAQALSGKGDYEGAIAAFQKAVEIVSALPKRARATDLVDAFAFPDGNGGWVAPAQHAVLNNFAWLLATCPQAKYRDPPRAVELAKKATQLAPKVGSLWNTLGVAHYRAGDWGAAVATLNKSMELGRGNDDQDWDWFYLATAPRALRPGGDAHAWFFLAMAHRKLGHTDEARKWYDQAIRWINRNAAVLAKNPSGAEELRRFRREAEAVLELKK